MIFNRFLPDYGVLPSAYFQRTAISNPIELFWSDDLCSLLRLCGEKEENIGEGASDFDKFKAILRALPLLEEHPTRAWIIALFDKYFNLKDLPCAQKAPEIWKILCDYLLERPLAPQDLVKGDWLCDDLSVPSELPKHVTPTLNANLLLETTAKKATDWSAEIAATVSHFKENRCQKIVLQLPDDFAFVLPSIYQVDRALSLSKKDREATNLLICQLVRELSTVAQNEDMLLAFVCNSNPDALVSLLKYVEESVGLPRVCWSTRAAKEAHTLLTFTAKPHKREVLAALPYEIVMTNDELSSAIKSWQVRYPIGKLCFVTACDFRQTPYARAHIDDMLQNSKTKL